MKKLILPLLIVIAAAAQAQTPKTVLDKYVVALGGDAAIKEIKDMTMDMSGTVQGQEMTMNMKKKLPNKLFMVVEVAGMGEVSKVQFDGEKGKMVQMGQETKIDEKTAANFKGQSDIFQGLSLYNHLDSTSYAGKDTIDNVVCSVLKYKMGNIDSKIYFDDNTGLLVRQKAIMDTPMGKNEVKFDFKDYRQVGKVKYPYVMKQDMGMITLDFLVTKILFNQNLDDAIFKSE